MKATQAELLALLDYHRPLADAVARSAGNPADRAERLARALQGLWPAPLAACWLATPGAGTVCVLDGTGSRTTAREEELAASLKRWLDAGRPEDALPADATTRPTPDDQELAAAPIAYRGERYGVLALAVPHNGRTKDRAVGRSLLSHAAEQVGLCLFLEGREQRPAAAASELPWSRFPDLAYAVAHEFNNILNNIMLQIAILEQSGKDESSCPGLGAIRQAGQNAAAMIRQLQQLIQQQAAEFGPVDLNQLVRDTVAATSSVEQRLAPDLPPVLGHVATLQDLLRLLLKNAGAGLAGRRVVVQTELVRERVVLRVEDDGPPVPEPMLHRLFEPLSFARPGGDNWDLTLARALTRRLRGNIQGANRPEGGMAVTVELRPAEAH